MKGIEMIPSKLHSGSHIRVIAPSRSMALIKEDCRKIANERLAKMGLKVSYGKNVDECDEMLSSSIKSRADDLNEAFADMSVDAILTVIGGVNCMEILDYLDYDLIKKNPKILCGFSDITALSNAIYAKTGLITYSGPHFSSFGMLKGFDYTLEYFQKCLMQDKPFVLEPSKEWSDDPWFRDQENRNFVKNDGYWVLNEGRAEGRMIGGNLGLMDELKGTPYFPDIKDCILFLEHCSEDALWAFNRSLEALMLHPDFATVKAVVFGRFEPEHKVTREMLEKILANKKELKNIPVIANVDFGHTTPIITFPVGGKCRVAGSRVELLEF